MLRCRRDRSPSSASTSERAEASPGGWGWGNRRELVLARPVETHIYFQKTEGILLGFLSRLRHFGAPSALCTYIAKVGLHSSLGANNREV